MLVHEKRSFVRLFGFDDGFVAFSVHVAESIGWSFRGLDGTMICWSFVRILQFCSEGGRGV